MDNNIDISTAIHSTHCEICGRVLGEDELYCEITDCPYKNKEEDD